MKYSFVFKKERKVFDEVNFTIGQFINALKDRQPKEIMHGYYSSTRPCYYIDEYKDASIVYHADGWADKTPQEKSYQEFYNELLIQGFGMFYFQNDEPDEPPSSEVKEQQGENELRNMAEQYFHNHKQTFKGMSAGDYIDKDDWDGFIETVIKHINQ